MINLAVSRILTLALAVAFSGQLAAHDCDGEALLLSKSELRLKAAKRMGLTQSEDSDFTIRRVERRGKFVYLDDSGDVITNSKTLARITAAKIRIDLTNTKVSDDPRSHIQAMGFDQKGDKQYTYHPLWNEVRNTVKFGSTLPAFAEALPLIREAVAKDLNSDELTEERLVAAVVRLLDDTLIRVGNSEYAAENKSFGLTTLRKSHVDIDGNKINFSFKGKSGVPHEIQYTSAPIAKLINALMKIPGRDLFKFRNKKGEIETVDSDSVNDYLKNVTKTDFTAKDFRTWGGTVAAAEYLHSIDDPATDAALEKAFAAAVRASADELENSPAASKKSYIHPMIFTLYKDNPKAFEAAFRKAEKRLDRIDTGRSVTEEAVFIILNEI